MKSPTTFVPNASWCMQYDIPDCVYMVQTDDGKHVLIDSGLPETMPEGESDFENGQDVIEQLTILGLTPEDIDTVISTHYDIDHAGARGVYEGSLCCSACASFGCGEQPRFWPIASSGISPASIFDWWTATRNCCRGWRLIETSGHVPGHQSVLLRLPKTGAVLLTIDAVPLLSAMRRTTAVTPMPQRSAPVRSSCLTWYNGSILDW